MARVRDAGGCWRDQSVLQKTGLFSPWVLALEALLVSIGEVTGLLQAALFSGGSILCKVDRLEMHVFLEMKVICYKMEQIPLPHCAALDPG